MIQASCISENSHGFNAGPNGYILSDGGINNGTCSFWWL